MTSTSSKKSRQARLRQEHRRRTTSNVLVVTVIALVVLGALGLIVALQNQQSAKGLLSISAITPEPVPAQADGKAIGPADAKVIVTEYSDFQ